MATYSGVIYSKTATLVASTVDHVIFVQMGWITVINHDATETITITTTGTDPTVDGNDTIPVLPKTAARLAVTSDTVELISGGTPKYTALLA